MALWLRVLLKYQQCYKGMLAYLLIQESSEKQTKSTVIHQWQVCKTLNAILNYNCSVTFFLHHDFCYRNIPSIEWWVSLDSCFQSPKKVVHYILSFLCRSWGQCSQKYPATCGMDGSHKPADNVVHCILICKNRKKARFQYKDRLSGDCTSTGQDVYIDLTMERIGSTVLELQQQLEVERPTEMLGRSRWANCPSVGHLQATVEL